MADYSEVDLADVVVTSERLTLRPWRRSDAPAVREAMQDRAMHEFLVLPDPYQHADAVWFVTEYAAARRRDGTDLTCALVETATGSVVGSADLHLPAPRRTAAEIGYSIYAPWRGHGYAAEASRTLAAWALARGVARVEIRCAVTNVASAKSALNAGFRYEGMLRRDVRTPAGPADGAVFSRVPDDPGDPVPSRFPALPPGGLTDGVLTLRALMPGDATALLEQESDPLTVGVGFSGAIPSADDAARTTAGAGLDWLVGTAARLAMVDAASGDFAGSLQLRLAGPPDIGGIGYTVHPAFRGRGFTTRALRLLVPWAFDVAGFARLELGAKIDNLASQQAAVRAGFVSDGIRHGRLRHPDGSFADEARFALVNPRHQCAGEMDDVPPQETRRINP